MDTSKYSSSLDKSSASNMYNFSGSTSFFFNSTPAILATSSESAAFLIRNDFRSALTRCMNSPRSSISYESYMGDPFTPPNSSSDTDLSWLFPHPPAKSSLPRNLLLLQGEATGEDGKNDALNDDAAPKGQAINKRRVAASPM